MWSSPWDTLPQGVILSHGNSAFCHLWKGLQFIIGLWWGGPTLKWGRREKNFLEGIGEYVTGLKEYNLSGKSSEIVWHLEEMWTLLSVCIHFVIQGHLISLSEQISKPPEGHYKKINGPILHTSIDAKTPNSIS